MTILKQSTPHGLSVRVPALQLLLGDQPENIPALARQASPCCRPRPRTGLQGQDDDRDCV